MPEHIQYEDDDLFNPETHHEHSDVPLRPLWRALIIFVIFGGITHFAIAFMYRQLADAESRRMDPPQTQVARPADVDVPKNQPLLQPFPRRDADGTPLPPNHDTPVTDLVKMRQAEDAVLHTYGWVDKQKGVVRIPIAEAKKLFVARQAVQSQIPQAATTTTTTAPTTTAATTTGGTSP